MIFMDSFQVPSRYNYYTRSTKGFSYDSRHYRKNQYDIWPLEDSIRNRRAYFVLQYPLEGLGRIDTIQTGKGLFYGVWIDKVRMYQKLNVSLEALPASWEKGSVKELQLKISNPYRESIALGNVGAEWKCYLEYGFKLGPDLGDFKAVGTNLEPIKIEAGQSVLVKARLTAPLVAGKYKLLFSVRTDPFSGARNSSMIPVEVR